MKAIQASRKAWREVLCKKTSFVAMLVVSLGAPLLLVGCEQPKVGGSGVEKRVADLEQQVGALQQQNHDLRAKLKASHGFGRTPLGDFFASPEFWQCTYDSSWADCSGRCSKQTSTGYQACLQKPEGPERVTCIADNTASGEACLKACPVQTSPIGPPECRGGAGPA